MNKKNKIKAIVALAVALAFVMPGAFANDVDTIGVTSNSENTGDIENIVEISTNSDTTDDSYNTLTLPVHNLDTGEDFATIQEAINDPETLDGHTIYVDNGVYNEIVVTKQLNLVGESKEGVIVDGSGSGSGEVVEVTASGVSITSFTMINGEWDGIYLPSSATGTTITNCICHSNACTGIWIDSSNNCIKNSIFHSNSGWGSDTAGLYIAYQSQYNDIINCTFYNNDENGIRIDDGPNTITECNFYDNAIGIFIFNAPSGVSNTIYHNNFIDNTQRNAKDQTTIDTWDNGYPSGGNYWSDFDEPSEGAYDDYHGPNQDQSGSDGIVDSPYDGMVVYASDQDNYPLMYPWEDEPEDTTPPEITGVDLTTSDPIDTIIGWEKVTCTVTDNVEVRDVKLVVTYPDLSPVEHPMIKDGDTYSYQTTFTDVGDYTYYVWADDTSDNSAQQSGPEPFILPPNYEVDLDYESRIINLWDLVPTAGKYGDTGLLGWVRADVDNDGDVDFWDLVNIAGHYNEPW